MVYDMDGQEIAEMMRKDVKKNLQATVKTTPSFKVARFVDESVLEKTVLSQYGKFNSNMRKADYDEKQHRQRGMLPQNTVWGGRLNIMDVPLNLSIEGKYFETFGHGFRTEQPDSMHQAIFCKKCGCKYIGDPAVQDLHCPRCGALTPIGELVEAKAYKRW